MSLRAKLVLIFLAVSIIPILIVSVLSLREASSILQKQIAGDLILTANVVKEQVLNFFDNEKVRMADWSSDGHIRSEVELIVGGSDIEKQKELGIYIKNNKQALDKSVILTDIYSLDGKVLASTDETRIGYDKNSITDSEEKKIIEKAFNASYGQVFVSGFSLKESSHETSAVVAHMSTPIVSLSNGPVGVMVNHLSVDEIDKILLKIGQVDITTGLKTKLESVPETITRFKTLEAYLVNTEGVIVTPSRFSGISVVGKKLDNLPTTSCFVAGQGIYDIYKNYRDADVYGASSCSPELSWVLVTEIERSEVLADVDQLFSTLALLSALIALLAVLLAILFGRRLVNRIFANTKVIEEIGKGNFEARAKAVGKDAIARSADGINKMAESLKKLTDQQTLLSSVVENTIEGVIITNAGPRGPEHKILYINKGCEDLYGYTAEELVGRESPRILKSGTQSAEFYNKFWQTIGSGNYLRGEIVNKRKDGTFVDVETIVVPIKRDGKIVNYVSIHRDISERKKAEESVRALNTLKNKFITVVSHQLQTPLSAIRWNLEMILGHQAGPVSGGLEDTLKISYEAVKIIIDRVRDLITAIDIEEGRIILEKEKLLLDDLIHSVLIETKPWFDQKKIKYIFEDPSEALSLMDLDSARIRDVLYKLIDNAVAYTKDGGEVKMKLAKKDSKVRFEISDNGIGIPASEQQHIFTSFHRASNAFAMRQDASGLGLYIAKSFIKAHGGDIGFQSEEGKGSTFWFELPIR